MQRHYSKCELHTFPHCCQCSHKKTKCLCMRCLLLQFVIFMSMRSAFKWPKITTSRLYQETLGTSQTRRTFHQRYQVSNCMCKKQHVCHYACAKGLETLKFDFQRPQRWLKAKCKKKKKTVRKPIKHSPSVQKETTYLMTKHILYYVFFAVFFWYHIACRDLLLQFSNQWLCHQI